MWYGLCPKLFDGQYGGHKRVKDKYCERDKQRETDRQRFKKKQAHYFITTGLKKETTQVYIKHKNVSPSLWLHQSV